jgi:hypothetical protein
MKRRLSTHLSKPFTANIGMCLTLVIAVLFLSGAPAIKNSVFTQDDWSGGVGTQANQYQSADKVITSNAGEVAVDNSPNPDTNPWCDVTSPTDYCNGQWSRRQAITLSNPAGTQTNRLVRLALPFKGAMTDDYRDLRFTDQAGTTGYEYYLSHWVAGSKVYAWVKIPSIANGNTSIYLYYGNAAATSLSNISIMYWADNFHGGSTLDPTYWAGDDETITNGELFSINHPHMIAPTGTGWDTTSQDFTFQYDVRMIDSYCVAGGVYSDGLEASWPSYQTSSIKVVDINCGSRQFNFAISGDGYGGTYTTQPTFYDFGSRVSVRIKSYTTGGFDYYYSTDDGKTFTQFENYTRNNAQPVNGDALFFNASPVYGIASNMTVVPSGPDIDFTIGAEQGINWCRTTNCDNSWTLRKEYIVKNNGPTLTNYQVRVAFTASHAIKDFSDIRFTDESGTRELNYFMEKRTDNSENPTAYFWVKMPTFATGNSKIYAYYNKTGVNSLSNADSTVIFSDRFASGNYQDYWYVPYPDAISVDTNEASATIEATNPDHSLTFGLDDGRSYTKAVDYDIKFNTDNINCNAGQSCYAGYVGFGDSSTINYNYHRNNDGLGGFMWLGQTEDATQVTSPFFTSETTPLRFNDNQYIRIRVVANDNGGNDYYFSTNEGKTFTKLNTSTNTSNQNVPYFGTANWYNGANPTFRNVVVHKYTSDITVSVAGQAETEGGTTGKLTSRIIDVGEKSILGNVQFNLNGASDVGIKLRSSPNADMSGAQDFNLCNSLANNTSAYDSDCVTPRDRYLQYQLVMPAGAGQNVSVDNVSIDYDNDSQAPNLPATITIQKDTGSPPKIVPAGSWINQNRPYFTWDAATDNGLSGLKAYCLYLGEDNTADPLTTSGDLKPYTYGGDYTGIDTGGVCQYATAQTELNTALNNVLHFDLESGHTYYLIIKTIDNFNNVSSEITQTYFKVDKVNPTTLTLPTFPAAAGSKIFHVSWLTGPLVQYGDQDSGFAGVKYCLSPLIFGGAGCSETDNNWYGKAHTSGRLDDTSDVIPFEDGGFDTVPADADRLDNQIGLANFVVVVGIDYAGNYNTIGTGVVVLTQMPAAPPENLQVTPASSTENAFSFTWDVPSFSLGSRSQLEYCWTVNEVIASDARNCHWTGRNVYSLAQNAYATKQGTNTLRLMTKDITGNFDTSQFASVDFTATTTAPGAPRSLDSSDASTKATSTWKIALSWDEPTLAGSGISTYRIFRSTDNSNFTEVGSTASGNTGFVDTGLSQIDYYYYVTACDNANSCSPPSSTVTRKPTGRYTTPPRLTADTDQPKVSDIGTKKANIFWFTDRDSDSKVAFGTESGKYFPEEVGNSIQTGNHSVKLTNLQPNTKYYYITRWTDSDGNTGVSQEKSFTTLPAPTISEVESKNVSISSANIAFRSKDASKVNIYYGRGDGLGGFQFINTASRESSYSVPISSLTDGTKYTFKLNGVDSDGNEFNGNTYSFTTPASPKISNLRFQPVTGAPSSTQKVSWNTNVPANSGLSYGPNGAKPIDVLDAKITTDHEMIISDLLDNTTYSLVARSIDEAGNTATSDTQTFKTALDTRAPKISNLTVESSIRGTGAEARGQAIVSWDTDEPASSQVLFGKGQSGSLTSSTGEDTRLSKNHVVVVSDLPIASIYRLQPVSLDSARNTTKGSVQTVVVGRGSDNVFGIILNALQKIFGI